MSAFYESVDPTAPVGTADTSSSPTTVGDDSAARVLSSLAKPPFSSAALPRGASSVLPTPDAVAAAVADAEASDASWPECGVDIGAVKFPLPKYRDWGYCHPELDRFRRSKYYPYNIEHMRATFKLDLNPDPHPATGAQKVTPPTTNESRKSPPELQRIHGPFPDSAALDSASFASLESRSTSGGPRRIGHSASQRTASSAVTPTMVLQRLQGLCDRRGADADRAAQSRSHQAQLVESLRQQWTEAAHVLDQANKEFERCRKEQEESLKQLTVHQQTVARFLSPAHSAHALERAFDGFADSVESLAELMYSKPEIARRTKPVTMVASVDRLSGAVSPAPSAATPTTASPRHPTVVMLNPHAENGVSSSSWSGCQTQAHLSLILPRNRDPNAIIQIQEFFAEHCPCLSVVQGVVEIREPNASVRCLLEDGADGGLDCLNLACEFSHGVRAHHWWLRNAESLLRTLITRCYPCSSLAARVVTVSREALAILRAQVVSSDDTAIGRASRVTASLLTTTAALSPSAATAVVESATLPALINRARNMLLALGRFVAATHWYTVAPAAKTHVQLGVGDVVRAVVKERCSRAPSKLLGGVVAPLPPVVAARVDEAEAKGDWKAAINLCAEELSHDVTSDGCWIRLCRLLASQPASPESFTQRRYVIDVCRRLRLFDASPDALDFDELPPPTPAQYFWFIHFAVLTDLQVIVLSDESGQAAKTHHVDASVRRIRQTIDRASELLSRRFVFRVLNAPPVPPATPGPAPSAVDDGGGELASYQSLIAEWIVRTALVLLKFESPRASVAFLDQFTVQAGSPLTGSSPPTTASSDPMLVPPVQTVPVAFINPIAQVNLFLLHLWILLESDVTAAFESFTMRDFSTAVIDLDVGRRSRVFFRPGTGAPPGGASESVRGEALTVVNVAEEWVKHAVRALSAAASSGAGRLFDAFRIALANARLHVVAATSIDYPSFIASAAKIFDHDPLSDAADTTLLWTKFNELVACFDSPMALRNVEELLKVSPAQPLAVLKAMHYLSVSGVADAVRAARFSRSVARQALAAYVKYRRTRLEDLISAVSRATNSVVLHPSTSAQLPLSKVRISTKESLLSDVITADDFTALVTLIAVVLIDEGSTATAQDLLGRALAAVESWVPPSVSAMGFEMLCMMTSFVMGSTRDVIEFIERRLRALAARARTIGDALVHYVEPSPYHAASPPYPAGISEVHAAYWSIVACPARLLHPSLWTQTNVVALQRRATELLLELQLPLHPLIAGA